MPPAHDVPPSIVLRVPIPPSTNNLFATVDHRRIKTKAYRDWLKDAGWQIKIQCRLLPSFTRPGVRVLIEVDAPRVSDLDNRIKAMLDLLVYVHVLADDSLVDHLTIIRRGEKATALVSIWPT